jgi:hypothetical protein
MMKGRIAGRAAGRKADIGRVLPMDFMYPRPDQASIAFSRRPKVL